jgi:uncharacterized membrane protein YjfL (UPF0719 family)
MNLVVFFLGLGKLVFALGVAVLGIIGGSRVLKRLMDIPSDEAVKGGNVAAAIVKASSLVGLAVLVRTALMATFDAVDLTLQSPKVDVGRLLALGGYALARRGTNADYVGPVIAKAPQHIDSLLDQVLSQLPGRRVYIDLNMECAAGTRLLSDRGFVKERDLIRMVKGGPGKKTSPLVVAIAGPEIG